MYQGVILAKIRSDASIFLPLRGPLGTQPLGLLDNAFQNRVRSARTAFGRLPGPALICSHSPLIGLALVNVPAWLPATRKRRRH